jgi:2-oxoglutarate-Fe(II)-dependent oxygenase superfamily protein
MSPVLERPEVPGRDLHLEYRSAAPWAHIIIDGAVSVDTAQAITQEAAELPVGAFAREWSRRVRKLACNRLDVIGPVTASVLRALQGADFQSFLERLSGIDALVADPSMLRAGLFVMPPGAHQVIHEDFPRHPTTSLWNRLVVLLYTSDHADGDGGELELWSSDMRRAWTVRPKPGRLVVFETLAGARHAVRPVRPGTANRVALSVRYYSAQPPPVRPTGPLRRTVRRPGEPLLSILPSRSEISEYVRLGVGGRFRSS